MVNNNVLKNQIDFDFYIKDNLEVNTFPLDRVKEAFESHNNKMGSYDALLKQGLSKGAYNFFSKHVILNSKDTFVVPKGKKITSYSQISTINNIVLLDRMNDLRNINKYFEIINEQIDNGSLLLGSFETFTERMKRSRLNKIPFLSKLNKPYHFIFKRVLPKLSYTKGLYFNLTKGKDRLLSKAEALGRLVSCGFEIVDVKEINGLYYYVIKKVSKPAYDMNASYGPLFKMKRVGKNGKIIGVYKFRTMHPYSEYLQDYVVKNNGYSETGKPANDFRVVPWAKTLRRYWLDELPQLINLFKGDLKLVGIRPVSKTYFANSIPNDIQELRLTQKPGCIPPYVALNRKSSVESVLEAEREYLTEKIRNPYITDVKYFFKAIYNILIKNKRSA